MCYTDSAKSDSFLSQEQRKSLSCASAEALFAWLRITSGPVALNHRLSSQTEETKIVGSDNYGYVKIPKSWIQFK